jgi:hypothetical protein
MLSNARRTYALDMFTVENRGGKWFYSRSAYHGDKHEWKGPYSSMVSVTLMIARQLKREITNREDRHKLPD